MTADTIHAAVRAMATEVEVYTADSPVHPRQAQADELAAMDRDAVIYWLRHSGVADRVALAARVMTTSVFAQAALVGLVTCPRCGDRGCDWCRSGLA